jgi:hypothetical protein
VFDVSNRELVKNGHFDQKVETFLQMILLVPLFETGTSVEW